MKHKGKIVLVTGASRGIGAEIATLFGKEEAKVIVNYNSHEEHAKKVCKKIGNNALLIKGDVQNGEQVQKMFDKVNKKYGRLDILINNAGIVSFNSLSKLSLLQWKKTFAVNVEGVFNCCQKAIPLLKKGGSIVNIASIRGSFDHGRPIITDYSASKSAVISFTKTLAKELAPDIRVNCVSPGITNTEMARMQSKETLQKFIDAVYLKRLIEPEEIADAVSFLASDEASAITGVNLIVDGGQTLGK